MDPNQRKYQAKSSTSSTECDRCQENIQKRCQVEEENKRMKERLKKMVEFQEKMKKLNEEVQKNY